MFRLLVVDDEEAVVNNLALTMRWTELDISEVHKAFSAAEALDILEVHAIHIVITDVRMPGMSGLELVRQIGKQWSRIKCLILSGYADFDYARQALQNQTVDYLLKPIRESDLMSAVERAIVQIREEWESISSLKRAQAALTEHLPQLKNNLLGELLQGKRYSTEALKAKLEQYNLSFREGDAFSLMLVRVEEDFTGRDFQSMSLMEYAIINIAEELGERHFDIWACKDVHEHLVLGLKPKNRLDDGITSHGKELLTKLVEQFAIQIQESAKLYLKVGVSVIVAQWSEFSVRIGELYQEALSTMRERLGSDKELVFVSGNLDKAERRTHMSSLSRLYEPPTLLHLLDAGRWEAVREKVRLIFDEAERMSRMSTEQLMEIYFVLSGSATYIAHKSGYSIMEAIGDDAAQLFLQPPRTFSELRNWATRVYAKIENTLEQDMKLSRFGIVERVQSFIEAQLSKDVSIQSIAEYVYLHPVYLSRIYKLETGESIGQYLLQLRMEKAAVLLKQGQDKIMDVAAMLGYQNATYFSKVFKEYYGLTPQQFRDEGVAFNRKEYT